MICLASFRPVRGYTILVALWALSAAGRTSAQVPEQATVAAQPAVTQAVSPAPAPHAPGLPSVAQAALGAEASAWQQLQLYQQRERELWLMRDAPSFALPGVAVGLGFTVASILLPIGGALMANANAQFCSGSGSYDGGYEYDCEGRDRGQFAVGTTLLTFGLVGLAGAVWGVVRIHQLRRARVRGDQELRSISEARTALENVIGARFAR